MACVRIYYLIFCSEDIALQDTPVEMWGPEADHWVPPGRSLTPQLSQLSSETGVLSRDSPTTTGIKSWQLYFYPSLSLRVTVPIVRGTIIDFP